MKTVPIFAKISLLLFLYFVVYYLYVGLLNPIPGLGDSWDYHIPIAQSLLNGTFLTVPDARIPQWYYPGSAEAINALLMSLHVPLTISNLLAILVLFFCLWKLGMTFGLDRWYALLFTSSFCTSTVILRWMNAVSIDVWVAVCFSLALILLQKPEKTLRYFMLLGLVLGMMIGSKYTAWYFLIILFFVYSNSILQTVSISRVFAFSLPFSIVGLFWYVRNYFLVQNPIYPIELLGFKGQKLFTETVWQISLSEPFQMLTALFSEYKFWALSPLIAFFYLLSFLRDKKRTDPVLFTLFLIGLLNLLVFTLFPTDDKLEIMISSFRYSYPIFIPCILGVFILAAKYKKEEYIGYLTIASMFPALSMSYYPKLILVYLPLAALCFYFLDRRNPSVKK